MSEPVDLKGWTLGGRPERSGLYAIIDKVYARPHFAYWNNRDARWSWEGSLRGVPDVWYHRPAPALPSDVRDRWRPAED